MSWMCEDEDSQTQPQPPAQISSILLTNQFTYFREPSPQSNNPSNDYTPPVPALFYPVYFYTDAPSLHFHRRWGVTVGVAAETVAREVVGPVAVVADVVAGTVADVVAVVVGVVANAAAVVLVTVRTSSKWTGP